MHVWRVKAPMLLSHAATAADAPPCCLLPCCCSAAAAGSASAFDFTLALMPRLSAVAERILEERGVLGDVVLRCGPVLGA